MSKQFTGKFLRDDGEAEIKVAFTITPGDPGAGPSYASGGHPPSDPEIELCRVWLPSDIDTAIALTEVEEERIMQEIAEGDEFITDDRYDPDDARDRMIDDRLMGFDQ